MPIGSISKSGNSFSGAAEYDLAQGKYAEQEASKQPEILERNFISEENFKKIGKEFREVSTDNTRCKKPVLKFAISFDPKENLTEKQKFDFTKNVMKEMGIKEDNHQFMITRHSDKGHDHHHILANRVGMDGKALSDSYSKNRLETAIDKTEKTMQINNDLAKSRRFVFDETTEKGYSVQKKNFKRNKEVNFSKGKEKGIAEKKEYIKNQVEKSLQQSKNISELQTKLQEKNINVEPRFNKENKLTGISFNYNNYSVKGSALGKEFKSSGIEKSLETNLEKGKINSINTNQLRKETLENIDKAIQKIEPYREHNPQAYNGIKAMEKAIKSDNNFPADKLNQANQVAKNQISNIENQEKAQERKPENINSFDQARQKREAKQEQEQNQERNRGFRR